jgi:hypothetical protein
MTTGVTDPWSDDLLGRKQDADFLYNFLVGQVEKRRAQGRPGSYVVNLDADWGGGKTFFLDRLKLHLESRGHIAASVNAWRDDHASDPYVAIMSAIDRALEPYVKRPGKLTTAWGAAKNSGGKIALSAATAVGKGLFKKFAGTSFDEVADVLKGEGVLDAIPDEILDGGVDGAEREIQQIFDKGLQHLIDKFKETDKAIGDFRDKLSKMVRSLSVKKKTPLFVLVDELDRCRPSYAIQLLERVKHLFDVDGVVFVFATNSEQLQHSVSGAYGPGFNGFRYLKRFFDRTYVFASPSIDKLVAQRCSGLLLNKLRGPSEGVVAAISNGCKAFGFDLRAIDHVVELIDVTAAAWPHDTPIDIALLFPLCAHFYVSGKAEWPDRSIGSLHKWEMPRIRHGRSGGPIDKSVKLGEAYLQGVAIFESMEKIVNDRSSSTDPTTDYTRDMFNAEWNGRSIDVTKPSVQTELLGLVANAGRMASSLEEPTP